MTRREAMDWLFSPEGVEQYPDYAERWKAAVLRTFEPVLKRAELEGLWLYRFEVEGDDLERGEHWWTPAEMRACHEVGEFIWWADSFELKNPMDKLAEIDAKVAELRLQQIEWVKRMRDVEGYKGLPARLADRDKRVLRHQNREENYPDLSSTQYNL